ncbi:DUF4126 domain-containing protein [Ktedonospora formicarum]|uniref:DUF4126 domain-containing protein n=1 Tax=Ktedonospora formicarum TaxID=2778364 RepID=A0A8J3IGE1_9CHLR|nr:DUF4126 domain-containing protein [Ktedonospora formicarum]GHO50679.1 hypothetical protein KSX_88420 [Ktedonospora formicarum]
MDMLGLLGLAAGLAFLSGINAYLPLLAVCLFAQLHLIPGFHINPDYAFLSHPISLVILAILAILNFVLDKVPGASAIWNTVHTVLRPIAGALVAGAVGVDHRAMPLAIVGAVMAALSHTTKMGIRTSASAVTGGGATPVLGLAEDVGVGVAMIVVFVAPLVVFYLLFVFVILFLLFAPSLFGALRYQWLILMAFFAKRSQRAGNPQDFLEHISPPERALFAQMLPHARPLGGVDLLWHRHLAGRGPWGKRRVVLPTWVVATDQVLLFSPPSHPRLLLVVPFASIRALDFKKSMVKGALRIQEHSGQRHEFTVLKTHQEQTEKLVGMLITTYHLPTTSPQRAKFGAQPSWHVH